MLAAKIEEYKCKGIVEILSNLRKQIKESKTYLEESLLSGNAVQESGPMSAGINAYKVVLDKGIEELMDGYELRMIYYSEMVRTGDFKGKHTANVHGKTERIITPLNEYDRVLKIVKKYPELA